jgi:hypothetical protein
MMMMMKCVGSLVILSRYSSTSFSVDYWFCHLNRVFVSSVFLSKKACPGIRHRLEDNIKLTSCRLKDNIVMC